MLAGLVDCRRRESGIGSPWGSTGRVAEHRRHPLHQHVGHRVLQPLGLIVNGVPGVAQERDEVGLDEAVPAKHAERRAPAVLGELDALVGHVLQQPLLGQPLDHAADRGGRQLQQIGDLAGGGGAALRRKPINGLEIVLDRARQGLVL